jgi:hypothetical protein
MKIFAMLLTALLACALLAGSASAKATYTLSGKQVVVDEEEGISKMRGSLIGRWTTTSFQVAPIPGSPYFHGTGTEEFRGCLNRGHDRSCKGDPRGTLSLTFEYWALFGSEDPSSIIWGACWHPVVGGTGDFASANGVLMFVDTPRKDRLKTSYIGNLTLKGKPGKPKQARVARVKQAR